MRRALIDAGLQVITVVPYMAGDRPDTIECAGDDRDNPIYTLAGSSKQCVEVAVGMDLVRDVSVVVAGISEAAPSEPPAASAATLQAATEGALLGYPAIAISQYASGNHSLPHNSAADDLQWCGVIGAELVAWLGVSPPPVRSVLNVCVPGTLRDRRLTLASSHSDGSDRAAVSNGHVCVAPVNLAGGMGSAVRLFDWASKSVATIGARVGATDGRCAASCCV